MVTWQPARCLQVGWAHGSGGALKSKPFPPRPLPIVVSGSEVGDNSTAGGRLREDGLFRPVLQENPKHGSGGRGLRGTETSTICCILESSKRGLIGARPTGHSQHLNVCLGISSNPHFLAGPEEDSSRLHCCFLSVAVGGRNPDLAGSHQAISQGKPLDQSVCFSFLWKLWCCL